MNTTDLLAIALRLFALFLLYSAFVMGIQHYQYIHQAATTGASDDIGALLVLGIIQVGGLLLAATLLLKFPLPLARRLAPAPAAEANSGTSCGREPTTSTISMWRSTVICQPRSMPGNEIPAMTAPLIGWSAAGWMMRSGSPWAGRGRCRQHCGRSGVSP